MFGDCFIKHESGRFPGGMIRRPLTLQQRFRVANKSSLLHIAKALAIDAPPAASSRQHKTSGGASARGGGAVPETLGYGSASSCKELWSRVAAAGLQPSSVRLVYVIA